MALKPHYLSEVSEEKIQAVLNELNLSSLNELLWKLVWAIKCRVSLPIN